MLLFLCAMAKPHAKFRVPRRELVVGEIPLVVGTLSALAPGFPAASHDIPSDVVEFRLDKMPGEINWLNWARLVEAAGVPVIATIRLRTEGGDWPGPDRERLSLYTQALENLSAVDVEFNSEICAPVSEMGRKLGKLCILSFHDFERTPPVADLQEIASKAQNLGSVVKISTVITKPEDLETLEKLLALEWRVPLCVIGMGPLGTNSRVSLAAKGSCLTYGYLDQAAAPGQLAASELVAQLRAILPAYDRHFSLRQQVAEAVR
jgi:3-dehydroquinate dehydratase-1